MIPLRLPAVTDAVEPFVARLSCSASDDDTLTLVENIGLTTAFSGPLGLIAVDGTAAADLDGDVVLVEPRVGSIERLVRSGSKHNTLLVTERCDQLCVMCSQPPKKTHVDRFALLERACLLAEPDSVIGITGGEPTLFKGQLLEMVERVLTARPQLRFHILTNGQHFQPEDSERLAQPMYGRVQWGIPIYSSDAASHDAIVGKDGAFVRLEDSLATLALAGASIELRTVVLTSNVRRLAQLAQHLVRRLPFITTWSIMQLENIGFARRRWGKLRFDHAFDFGIIGDALDIAVMNGLGVQLFNFPRCTVPPPYRPYAVASISDWKQRFGSVCAGCNERAHCSGFFEWHPLDEIEARATAL